MGPSTSWSPVSSGDSHFLSIWRHHPPPPGNCCTYFSTLSLLQLFCWETTALFHGLFCLETCSLSMFLESSSRSCSCRRRLACGAEGQGVGQEAGNLCVFPAPLLLHPRVWKLNPRRGPNGWLHSPCPRLPFVGGSRSASLLGRCGFCCLSVTTRFILILFY